MLCQEGNDNLALPLLLPFCLAVGRISQEIQETLKRKGG
jgi:hypothetical protein